MSKRNAPTRSAISNLFYTDLTNGWMLAPDFKLIEEYERSVKQYPNIKPGDDFRGYHK
ncbi:MAG: hypothetical protein WBD95_02575 [Xanthobacteraceae bacterium]